MTVGTVETRVTVETLVETGVAVRWSDSDSRDSID